MKPPEGPSKKKAPRAGIKDALGYVDHGIGTPAHDTHLLWLEDNLHDVLRSLVPRKPWEVSELNRARDHAKSEYGKLLKIISESTEVPAFVRSRVEEWTGLGDPPSWGLQIGHHVLQSPLRHIEFTMGSRSGKRAPVCFLDLEVEVRWIKALYEGRLENSARMMASGFAHVPHWGCDKESLRLYFLVETAIEGYAELIQRVRAYQQHAPGGRFVIVCPDDRFAQSFRRQGISFVQCPAFEGSARTGQG